jgi:RNA polymerase subunit RPABC4/transcription elongation factor Spt4
MTRKICLKCLEVTHLGGEHCTHCGEKFVDFTLMCECGAEIYPYFGYRVFPPWGRQITKKYCPDCGRDTRKPVKDYLKELRWLFSQAK